MKNQTQIERKTNRRAGDRQQPRRREIAVSQYPRDSLAQFARETKTAEALIVERLVKSYCEFIEEYPHLATAQPRLVNRSASLWLPEALCAELVGICLIHDLEVGALVDRALRVYFHFVTTERDELKQFAKDHPGEIDPHQIAYIISQPSHELLLFVSATVRRAIDQRFTPAVEELAALRELTMYHPGLEKHRVALEMIAEGADRLACLDVSGKEVERLR
jgi:hypothetical protein